MQDGGFVPWDEWKPTLNTFTCPCCMGVTLMPTEEELEQHITDQIDRERVKEAILSLEIKQLRETLDKMKGCDSN